MACEIGVSLPTVRQAESGLGSLSSLVRLAGALAKQISGRSLPPGAHLGARPLALRTRLGVSRRDVAALAGVSPTSLAALEAGGESHLATVLRVAEALGVTLRLAPLGEPAPFWTSAAASSAHGGWTSPPGLLALLYPIFGRRFGLDVCSPVRRGPKAPVKARLRYVAEDDALRLPWRADSVFMNPPYGRHLKSWVAKAHAEARSGRSGIVVGLLLARCDTGWWHDHVAEVADIWMLRGRLAFGDGSQPAPFPSALVLWSATDAHRRGVTAAFPSAWHVAARHQSRSSAASPWR